VQPPAPVCLPEAIEVLATEDLSESTHREEESRPAGDPAGCIPGERPAGYDRVHVRMLGEALSPGMKHRQHTDLSGQV
jgi:hypothetical protein